LHYQLVKESGEWHNCKVWKDDQDDVDLEDIHPELWRWGSGIFNDGNKSEHYEVSYKV
jgi:hypothetical protein